MILIFIFLVIAGIMAGLLASVAGLASLISYPALLIIGVPPVIANVTNTTALIFSGIGSTISSLKELHGHWKELLFYIFLSLIGSAGGSTLLLIAPASAFEKVVPFFILASGILLLLSSRKTGSSTKENKPKHSNSFDMPGYYHLLPVIGIILVGAYTGYFGAAGGIVFLAILSVITNNDFAVVNAMKNVIAFAGNLAATIIFIFKSHIDWLLVTPLGLGLLIGGYIGPIIVRHANIHLLRILISLAAFGLALYLFTTTYL